MNLLDHISKLVARSKTLSTIKWFPYSGGVYNKIIRDINTALAAAETEVERWQLLLSLLPLWTSERDTKVAWKIFGRETQWQYNEPLYTFGVDREPGEKGYRLSVNCGQPTAFEIKGVKKLLQRYHRELLKTGHVITNKELYERGYCE